MTEYAQCVKMLGNGRLEAKCQDGETRLGQIRGQMRKKVCHSEHASGASGRG
jgi:translation initiation factor 1A